MYFFGVTTSKSSSARMFPRWAEILGLKGAQLVGVDLPINGPADQYRAAVEQIKDDPLSLGALVTTHKINVLHAARDLFDELTPDAELCNEVSCIYKREGRLIGHAVDPMTSARSMRQFIPSDHWARTNADVLCFGAGGSAVAITTHFLTRAAPGERPRRFVLVNRSQGKLDFIRQLVDGLPPSGIVFEYIQNADPLVNDRLLAQLPHGSLVINATGMGKDTPGSPITDAGRFPKDGLAWELNYRGELDFMHQALRQREARRLHVEDGWYYFLVGWADIISTIFDVPVTPALFDRLAESAAAVR
ncbi:MAG: shikimate dehydrogenase [Anaerolineae bacterium]|nr:shikimate dehydrogenase [Anaerolineae bacterium]